MVAFHVKRDSRRWRWNRASPLSLCTANTKKRFQFSSARTVASCRFPVRLVTRVLSPSTKQPPPFWLDLECCRADSFQLWSSASSVRIRWNELALRNRKALVFTLPLISPIPRFSLSLSLSLLLDRFSSLSFPFVSSFVSRRENRCGFPSQKVLRLQFFSSVASC